MNALLAKLRLRVRLFFSCYLLFVCIGSHSIDVVCSRSLSLGYMLTLSLFYALINLTNAICCVVISNEFIMLSNDNNLLLWCGTA